MTKRLFAISAAMLSIAAAPSVGQELQCDVTINIEAIPSASRDYLRTFEADLEQYLNRTKFTDEDMMGDRILCTLDIFFKSATGENQYTAQVFVGSQRTVYNNDTKTDRTTPILRVLDEQWQFIYQPGQRMRQDDFTADALTDFLDFYAYIIIGMDLESYTPNAGAPYFRRAMNVCNVAVSGPTANEYQYQATGYSRYGLAEELTNPKYAAFHDAFTSYHMDGIDLLAAKPDLALENMLTSIEAISQVRKLQNPTSVIVKLFFDVKNREIADAFQAFPDARIFDRLGTYDQEHLSVYKRGR